MDVDQSADAKLVCQACPLNLLHNFVDQERFALNLVEADRVDEKTGPNEEA